MEAELKKYIHIMGGINGSYHDLAVAFGISDCQMEIFYVLCELGSGCNQSVLYKSTGLSRSTVNSAIRKMEKEALLYLKPGAGRNTCVYLTEKGEAFAEATAGRVMEIENRIFSSWSREEWQMFLHLNERYAAQLSEAVSKIQKEEAENGNTAV